jgi:hypothetical protein
MTYPNAARLLDAIPSSALIWWRLLHKTDIVGQHALAAPAALEQAGKQG